MTPATTGDPTRAGAPAAPPGLRPPAIGVGRRASLALALASVAGAGMFLWPLLLTPAPGSDAHTTDAPFLFVLVLPVVVAVVLAELADGGLDTKALAMLGVLSAIGAALRPLGAGTGGVELVFFTLVLAGRVLGPGFGFALGATTLFASALITAGVGPWLPFQMMASAWVGMGAGLLPFRRLRGRGEVVLLAVYGALAAYAYGFLMNLWAWPFALGSGTELSHVPGDAVLANLHRFVLYTLSTTSLGWDTGRAITNVLAIVLVGPAVLAALRRASRRAAFGAAVTFTGPRTEPAGRARP
jgi:energy-coupling factor transport system substrate-specific component